MTNWKEYRLGEIALQEKGAVISGPFGSNISSKFFVQKGVPVIRGNNLPNGMEKFFDDGFVFVTEEKARELNCWATKDDLLFTAAGTIGQVGLLTGTEKYRNYVISNKQIRVRLNKSIVSPLFAYYWFSAPMLNEVIKNHNTGSTIPLINLSVVKSLPINLPNLPTQTRIAAILSALDDKIELNRQMNHTLEQMAQALFKKYFVDDIDHENLPDGWRVAQVGEFIDSVSMTYSFEKPKVIFLNTGDIYNGKVLHKNYSDVNSLPGQAKKSIRRNDILFTEIRPANRRFAFINFDSEDYVVSTKLMVLRAKAEIDSLFFYFLLTREETLTNLQNIAEARSGTFPQITFDQVREIEFLLPDNGLVERFDREVLRPNYELIFKNELEIESLTQIRDSLLPKLMSGEIEIKEAETLVA